MSRKTKFVLSDYNEKLFKVQRLTSILVWDQILQICTRNVFLISCYLSNSV